MNQPETEGVTAEQEPKSRLIVEPAQMVPNSWLDSLLDWMRDRRQGLLRGLFIFLFLLATGIYGYLLLSQRVVDVLGQTVQLQEGAKLIAVHKKAVAPGSTSTIRVLLIPGQAPPQAYTVTVNLRELNPEFTEAQHFERVYLIDSALTEPVRDVVSYTVEFPPPSMQTVSFEMLVYENGVPKAPQEPFAIVIQHLSTTLPLGGMIFSVLGIIVTAFWTTVLSWVKNHVAS